MGDLDDLAAAVRGRKERSFRTSPLAALAPTHAPAPAAGDDACGNCGRVLGQLEQAFVWGESAVCATCHDLLARQGPARANFDLAYRTAPSSVALQGHQWWALWAGVGALALCALAPFLDIVTVFGGGVATIGLWSGKFVLVVSLICLAGPLLAQQRKEHFQISALAGMFWGTVVGAWALYVIYKIQALPTEPFREGADPFEQGLGALLATQISPGAGAFFGLVGGGGAAAAFGYLYALSKSRNGRVEFISLLPVYGAALMLAAVVGSAYAAMWE